MADKFLRCEVVGSIANSITVKPYVDGAGIITVCQQDNILFDPDTLRAEGAEEMRQAALNALARTAREKFNLSDEYNHYLAGLMDGELAIKGLPTIQPEVLACGNGELVAKPEPQWIPVSERLPEDLEEVNVTWVNRNPESYYESIKDKPFTATAVYYKGKWYWWSTYTQDLLAEYGERCNVGLLHEAIEITAWMPLPEPYQKGADT